MPVLFTLKYRNADGKILYGIGPKELYFPEIHSLDCITNEEMFDALEEKLEEYDWSGLDEVDVEWYASAVH